jgi:hypothetical protein
MFMIIRYLLEDYDEFFNGGIHLNFKWTIMKEFCTIFSSIMSALHFSIQVLLKEDLQAHNWEV